jgi:ATP-dependent DNA ligase
MQAKPVDRLPAGDQWRYELKLDGYRSLAIKSDAGVRLISRNETDLSAQFPELVECYGLTPTERRTAVWLKPVLSCQVRFTEWTADRHLRHPIFEGWSANKETK